MKKIVALFMSLVALVLMSGCASSVYYKTELDPTSSLAKNESFGIFLPKNPTIEDKKFAFLLQGEMKRQGFNVVSKGKPVYGILFTLTSKSYSGTSSHTSYVPTTSYTSGYVGGTYVSGTTTSSTPVSKAYSYTDTYKKIYIDIYEKKGTYNKVWSGFMSSDIQDYYKNPKAMTRQLVQLIGKEFKGNIGVEMDK